MRIAADAGSAVHRWIVLYNANLDRAPATRRTLDQLRLELRRAEEAEARTRKETVEDPVAYQVRCYLNFPAFPAYSP